MREYYDANIDDNPTRKKKQKLNGRPPGFRGLLGMEW